MLLSCRQLGKVFLAALMLCLLSVGVLAQSTPPARPSGSVSIHQVRVAFIGSGAMGGGTLSFQGRRYPFKLGGLGIGGIGISTIDAVGSVHNLRRLQDFNGVYGQARAGWAVGERAKAKCGCKTRTGSIYV
jgi:uncharacterized membrane protein